MSRGTILGIFMFLVLVYSFKRLPNDTATPPEWAKQAVWYQIFPERFWNGDTRNDPQLRDMEGGWPYFFPANWQVSPWTSDWYELQPWEKGIDWHEHFDWARPGEANFNAVAGLRRYGGDLQGVIDRLDYLQDLGITAIYFNPLFEAASLHKYDASMFHHIDNNFGPDPEKDREIWAAENPGDPATWRWTTADSLFLNLIDQCHRRGIRVIIDGVFNHTGRAFWAFQDLLKHQQDSPYKDWYTVLSWDDPKTPENEFDYAGWAGVKDLPEIREDENGLLEGPRRHIKAVVHRWMDPNGDGDPSDGIDGWRLDVAEKVSIHFWKDFYRWVKEVNPEGYITGELWWEDWGKNKMYNAAPWFEGAFDAVMNYRFARAVKKFVIDQKDQIPASAFADSLRAQYRDYEWSNLLVCQNLMGSHDVDRVASQVVNPDRWYDHDANPMQNPAYDPRKPNAEEYRRLRLISGLQMTLPGAPMIYYGDEAGMWGGDDPDPRKPMVWPELEYQPEKNHPLGRPRDPDPVTFDRELFEWHRRLIALRKAHPALSLGAVDFFLTDDENRVLGYRRYLDGQDLFVVVNNSAETVSLHLNLEAYVSGDVRLTNLLDDHPFQGPGVSLPVQCEPYEILVLKVQP